MAFDSFKRSFGDMLKLGAEIPTAIGLARGWAQERIDRMIYGRFQAISPQDADMLKSFAGKMVDSGIELDKLLDDQKQDFSSIPLNPFLWGDDAAGRRAWYTGDFSPDFGRKWYTVYVSFPDIAYTGEIRDAIRDQAYSRFDTLPGASGPDFAQSKGEILVRINANERRY